MRKQNLVCMEGLEIKSAMTCHGATPGFRELWCQPGLLACAQDKSSTSLGDQQPHNSPQHLCNCSALYNLQDAKVRTAGADGEMMSLSPVLTHWADKLLPLSVVLQCSGKRDCFALKHTKFIFTLKYVNFMHWEFTEKLRDSVVLANLKGGSYEEPMA